MAGRNITAVISDKLTVYSKHIKEQKNPALQLLCSAGFFLCLVALSANIYVQKSYASPPHLNGSYKQHVTFKPSQKNYLNRSIKLSQGISVKGTKKVAAILVQFGAASQAATTSGSYLLSFNDIIGLQSTVGYMRSYYQEASYNNIDIDITYFYNSGTKKTLAGNETPYTLPNSMYYYGIDDETGSDTNLVKLIKDSILMVGSTTLNSTNYDMVIIAHAGYGNESTDYDGDIWSSLVDLQTSVYGLTEGLIIPAKEYGASPIGVSCHEFGHGLGLPDHYKTGGDASSVVGKWCLMDYGAWAGNGFYPTQPCVWCKKYLGWVSPAILTSGVRITDVPSLGISSAAVYQLPILGSNDEYFLIHFSSITTYNQYTPGDGVLIWHIDEGTIDGTTLSSRLLNNSINNYAHPTVSLNNADSSSPSQSPFGDSTDPWPGTKIIFQSPDSDSFKNLPSDISIRDFVLNTNSADFTIVQLAMSTVPQLSKLINYPNPAGKGQFHPKQGNGILTTIVIALTKSSRDINLSIFNLTGEKVRDAEPSKIVYNNVASQDYKFVHEYDWDGKNDNGEDVAPGIYFYRVKTGSETKFGKMAIVR